MKCRGMSWNHSSARSLYSYHYIAGVASKEFRLSKKAAGYRPAAFVT
ncbi:hypothetical protein CHCC14600_0820 [Bacillus licheniformis]|nr:hypothetical protein B4092_0687 [Bacillus licheniformis]KYC74151.1 hypothetical protein B4090_0712 [Bacillus licheniformis]OLF98251.1 hypothetical protein B4094_0379 [Bacillus licheniformis]TWM63964.1 hypothetical protein CHCC14810_0458 [Bacillus licheniformis]TWM78238.1 hypothetical protein CHCC14688_0595 [Bacillus licheniformis]